MLHSDRVFALLDVVELESFSEAAKKRGVTTAAISKQISQLETEYGIQLLYRSSRSIELTDMGQDFYEKALEMRESFKNMESYLNGLKKTPQGVLRVFSLINFAFCFILPKIKHWLEAYPLVTLNLELGERTPDMEKENFDILMGSVVSEIQNAVQIKIGDMRYYLCASPNYIEKFGHPNTLAELRQHRYLTHTHRPKNYLIKADDEEVILEPYFYLNSFKGLAELAVQGLGFIWASEASVGKYLESGKLVELLPEKFKNNLRPIYLYYKQTRHVSSKVDAFVDFVKTSFSTYNALRQGRDDTA